MPAGWASPRIPAHHQRITSRCRPQDVIAIPTKTITELSYGQEVHRRIGTAAGLAVVSLGIGALVAFSKSKKPVDSAGADEQSMSQVEAAE